AMTVTRPRRLTSVVTEPMLLPIQTPPAPAEHVVATAPEDPPEPLPLAEPPAENLSEVRMRPRRVIVVK
ncbi:hypothetical protein, partial [Tabrizicola sp.]|uniref:hypothetical protein n=1 Tax=Tabrizicola sp. TaxID=2005166 RepID=UPI002631F9F1